MTEWNPRCHCGEPAVARLAFIWREDNSEQGRSRAKCRAHLDDALSIWDRLMAAAPDAVDGLRVLVVAP